MTLSAEFTPGTTVYVIRREPGTEEPWQMEWQPDPRRPALWEQRPPTDFDVVATAVAGESGETTIVLPDAPGGRVASWPPCRFWAIGWDPPGSRWKRLAFSA